MQKFFFLISLVLIGFACEKDQLDAIQIPDDVTIDVDQDGQADFVVTYSRQEEGDPAGNYEAVRMNLESTNQNQILKHEIDLPIFLTEIDLIQTQVKSPLFWETTNPSSNISTPIARIRTDYDGTTWNEEWRVFSAEEKESYLMGFKLLGGSETQVGFIEFLVDIESGEFVLLRAEIM